MKTKANTLTQKRKNWTECSIARSLNHVFATFADFSFVFSLSLSLSAFCLVAVDSFIYGIRLFLFRSLRQNQNVLFVYMSYKQRVKTIWYRIESKWELFRRQLCVLYSDSQLMKLESETDKNRTHRNKYKNKTAKNGKLRQQKRRKR